MVQDLDFPRDQKGGGGNTLYILFILIIPANCLIKKLTNFTDFAYPKFQLT